jgi:hypothetical protein
LRNPPEDADVYVEDEAEIALHPTITRTWMKRGRGRQTKIRSPGINQKRHLFCATDWKKGITLRLYGDSRDSTTFCSLTEDCIARSISRGKKVVILADNLGIHVPERARKVKDLLEKHSSHLKLVYLPKYSPDLQPQEKLWRVWRAKVTHNHQRATLEELEMDSEACFAEWEADPSTVLRIIGSPFASPQLKEKKYVRII